MKTSLICTVLNEEKTIKNLLNSIASQTKNPDEIIIVDGGSTDKTIDIIKKESPKFKNIILLSKKGNRAVGRNEAIKKSSGNIILCTDAGCTLEKNWVKNITQPFKNKKIDVVAGYYRGIAKNTFQKCLIPYTLVMPDKINPKTFLPASRSMAFRKSTWKKLNGFNEKLSHNEDYDFANRLKKSRANIYFQQNAIVYWQPRKNLKESFIMFFRFALGDAESKIWRTKVLILFARYILGIYLLMLTFLYKSLPGLIFIAACLICYVLWSVKKNYQYIKNKSAYYILPAIQLTADGAVIAGTITGVLKRIINFNYLEYYKKNKFLFLILIIYATILILTIKWGIPNQDNPFPYHMDEWHQLQAVANTFRYGTPNTAGSANGTLFHFLYSGLYLIPFTLLQITKPFELQINNPAARESIFIILRLQTILFGILSIFLIYKIAEILQIPKKITIFLFTFTPIWIMFSGYFKYDIALIFWILLAMLFFLKFARNPTTRNFLLASIPTGLAFAVKVSAIPLFMIYSLSYLMFHPNWKKNIKYLFLGLGISTITVILFGMPDTLFGKGNILFYIYENTILSPADTSNFAININPVLYLITHHYPIIFGLGLEAISILSCIILIYKFLKKGIKKNKIELFIFISFLIFIASLIPLKFQAGGNRSLVLLPFLTLISGLGIKETLKKKKTWTIAIILLITISQIYQTSAWVAMKYLTPPQLTASKWITKNIKNGETIGIENIPLYQNIPHIIKKEFYFQQYKIKSKNKYTYEIINSKTKKLPGIIIITNEVEATALKKSAKKELLARIKKEGYHKKITFTIPGRQFFPFINEVDFYFSWLLTAPTTTSVYIK